jgi:cysteine-rich repeat protein
MTGRRASRLRLLAATALLAAGAPTCDDDAPACGDRFLDSSEECDDGNAVNGDGCDVTCQLECGNGVLDPGEACDDGNHAPDDGCDDRCRNECGNGVLDGHEECDYTLTSGCGADCRWEDQPDGDADADVDADADAVVDAIDMDLPAAGGSLTLLGELSTDSATWQRPLRACDELATAGPVYPYEAWALHNRTPSTLTLTLEARGAGSGAGTLADGMLFLYRGSTLPTDALDCVASDDDGGEGLDPRITGAEVVSGADAFLAVTTFSESGNERAYGTYQLLITAQ